MQDAVDRLTPLGVMVLALLGEGDMHPYEMIRLMRIPPRRPARRDHERHDVPHGRPAREGRARRRGRRRSRGQPARAHDVRSDGCGLAAVTRMGASRAAARRSPGRVPHRARRGAQPRTRRGRSRCCARAATRVLPRRPRIADSDAVPPSPRACPTQYLLELERRGVAARGRPRVARSRSFSALEAEEFPWGATTPSRALSRTDEKAARL